MTTSDLHQSTTARRDYARELGELWQQVLQSRDGISRRALEQRHHRVRSSSLPVGRLTRRFDLTPGQLAVVEYAHAWELGLLGGAGAAGQLREPLPMVADIIRLLDESLDDPASARGLFARSGLLRRWCLIELEDCRPRALPLSQLTYRLSETVADFLVDQPGVHPRVYRHLDAPPPAVTSVSRRLVCRLNVDGDADGIALSAGDLHWGKRVVDEALSVADKRGLWLSVHQRQTGSGDDMDDWLALAVRDARLTARTLVVTTDDEATGARVVAALARRGDDVGAVVIAPGEFPALPGSYDGWSLQTLGKVDDAQRVQWWNEVFPGLSDRKLARLGRRFELDYAAVARARSELGAAVDDGEAQFGDIAAFCRRRARRDVGPLVHRVETTHDREDLVVPDATNRKLDRLVAWMDHRRQVLHHWGMADRLGGRPGLATLFSGPPGTGKTMAASILADHIGLDLFRVDLAAVVSKYIGETEKNLDRVFDAAEAGCAVLFFDEADALFGRRAEVKDARDRYANLEVSYLLQRMEDYRGLAILATNLEKNLDEAFRRRLQFVVRFPRPGRRQREVIWRRLLGDGVPLGDDVDFEVLARRFTLTGGHIRNCAIDAAFLAAENGQVTMEDLMRAVARQLKKAGESPGPDDFGPYYEVVQSL